MTQRRTRSRNASRRNTNRQASDARRRRRTEEEQRPSSRRPPRRRRPEYDERHPRRRSGSKGSGRILALDGLRALAIIAIVIYHLGMTWLPSGHMGVVLFLVLSGYLVTASILKALRREGASALPGLWVKRVVRIWPSMALMIAVTVAACVLFNHILLTKLRPDLVPSLLLANNIGAILRGASYFDNLGGTSPLTHLWYLGVDIQFFLVWSILLVVLCPSGRPSRPARLAALVLSVISAILMAILFDPNGDPTRVYYGPDTRAFAPLLGAWLGLAWPLGKRPVRLDSARHTVKSLPLSIVGPVGLVGLICIMVFSSATSAFLYRGGMLLAAVFSLMLLAGAIDTKTPLSQVFSLRPLTWLGERSYGIYLWHFPFFQLFKVTYADTSPLIVVFACALSLLMAEISLRFVDNVIAQGRLPFIPNYDSSRRGAQPNAMAWIPAGALALLLAGGLTGVIIIPDETAVPDDAIRSTGEGAAVAIDLSKRKQDSSQNDESTSSSSSSSSSNKSSGTKKSSDEISDDEPIVLEASSESIEDNLYTPLVVADSVAGDAQSYFETAMPNGFLDSYVGRMPAQAASTLKQYIDQDVVGDIVIVASFSNCPPSESELEDILDACGDRALFLVNARIPEVEEEQINKTLKSFANSNENVELIDWHSYSDDHDEWFYDDQTHLNEKGAPEYAKLIAHSIAKEFEKRGGTILSEDDAKKSDTKSTGGSKVVDPTAT